MQKEARWKMVYNQINGIYVSGLCGDVKDETAEGGELAGLIEQIYQARERLCKRMKFDAVTDPDLEDIFNGFEDLSRVCGKLMYHYGRQDAVNT